MAVRNRRWQRGKDYRKKNSQHEHVVCMRRSIIASWKTGAIALLHLNLPRRALIRLAFTMTEREPPTKKRRTGGKTPGKRGRKNLVVEGDFDTADAVTHENITTVTPSGETVTKRIEVPFVPSIETPQKSPVWAAEVHDHGMHDHYTDQGPDLPRRTRKV